MLRQDTFWHAGRNLLRNSRWEGAAVGNPGTPPRGMSFYMPDAGNGVTFVINDVGTESDFHEYMEWRVLGPSTVTGGSYIFLSQAGDWPVPNPAMGMTISMDVRSIAGTMPLSIGLGWNERAADGTLLTSPSVDIKGSLTNSYDRYRQSKVCNSSAAWIEPYISIGYQNGVSFDIVLHISKPQVEHGLVMTPYEPRLVV